MGNCSGVFFYPLLYVTLSSATLTAAKITRRSFRSSSLTTNHLLTLKRFVCSWLNWCGRILAYFKTLLPHVQYVLFQFFLSTIITALSLPLCSVLISFKVLLKSFSRLIFPYYAVGYNISCCMLVIVSNVLRNSCLHV